MLMKNVKNRFLVLLTLLFTGSSLASATKQPDRIFLKGVCTEITFYSPTTVRILKYPQNKTPLKESLVVLQKPEKCKKIQLKINIETIKAFKASNKASEGMSDYK